MKETLLIIVLALNVFFLWCIAGFLNRIDNRIDSVKEAETKAFMRGVSECLRTLELVRRMEKDKSKVTDEAEKGTGTGN